MPKTIEAWAVIENDETQGAQVVISLALGYLIYPREVDATDAAYPGETVEKVTVTIEG
jgi:hypothetical protein